MADAKIDPKVAKGALAGAAAACASGDKSWKAEEALRDALKAARNAGASEDECAKIVGNAVMNSIDRYGPASIGEGPMVDKEPRGLARTLTKIGSSAFTAGFLAASSRRS